MSKENKKPEISTLKRREIQAAFFARLFPEFSREMGYDKAMEAALAAIREDARQAGQFLAEKFEGNSIQVFKRIIGEVWAQEDAIEYTILEETEKKLRYTVTRCRYAELYDSMGVKEFGVCLSCSRDEAFLEGFNPRMKLTRTHTIMEGKKDCDFLIVVE
jgi:L-2-amino-thiazoline-4-carboxylic acid hydrolase